MLGHAGLFLEHDETYNCEPECEHWHEIVSDLTSTRENRNCSPLYLRYPDARPLVELEAITIHNPGWSYRVIHEAHEKEHHCLKIGKSVIK